MLNKHLLDEGMTAKDSEEQETQSSSTTWSMQDMKKKGLEDWCHQLDAHMQSGTVTI
jgi:hypothetical protein